MKTILRQGIKIVHIFLVLVFLWISISTTIQAFKCPEMTQTELLINIHKSFLCDWKKC